MTDTANRILDSALMLIQSRGFSAISYNDIAEKLDLKKASIHYHFASKSDLGVAVVKRYAADFSDLISNAESKSHNTWHLLEAYFGPYRQFGETSDRICLCGALGGEFLALPEPVQIEVSTFFAANQNWLEKILQTGRRTGELQFSGSAKNEAQLVFSALQGALLVKRTIGSAGQLENVISTLTKRWKP